MDVLEVRRPYGRDLRIWGGVDKRALARGPAAIDAELAARAPADRGGRLHPGLDHSCPPDVPYENYQYYWRRLAEAVGREVPGTTEPVFVALLAADRVITEDNGKKAIIGTFTQFNAPKFPVFRPGSSTRRSPTSPIPTTSR